MCPMPGAVMSCILCCRGRRQGGGPQRARVRAWPLDERRSRSGVVQREDVTAGCYAAHARQRAREPPTGRKANCIRGLQRRSEVQRAGGQTNCIGPFSPSKAAYFGTRVPCPLQSNSSAAAGTATGTTWDYRRPIWCFNHSGKRDFYFPAAPMASLTLPIHA